MRIATTIFTYGGGQKITKRHLPIWREYSDDILLVFPDNDPCLIPETFMISHEVSNKFGIPCLKRQLFGMKAALRYAADYYVFTEYDGFMLKRPEPRKEIQANVFMEPRGRYQAGYFTHFPWIFPAALLKEFCEKATLEPFEEGFVDRWVAAQLKILGMPVFNLQASGEGYSRNSIESDEEIADLLARVNAGAYAIHGIKDAHLLKRVLETAGQSHLVDGEGLEPRRGIMRHIQAKPKARRA
jgi:hypothetical protein